MPRRQSNIRRNAATATCAPARQPARPQATWPPGSMPVTSEYPANAAADSYAPIHYPVAMAYGHPGQSYGPVVHRTPPQYPAPYGSPFGYGPTTHPSYIEHAYHTGAPMMCNGSCYAEHPPNPVYVQRQYPTMTGSIAFAPHAQNHPDYQQRSSMEAQHIAQHNQGQGQTTTEHYDTNSYCASPNATSPTFTESPAQSPTTPDLIVRPMPEPRRGSKAVQYYQHMNQRSLRRDQVIDAPVKRARQQFSESYVRDVPRMSLGSHCGPYVSGIGASETRRASSDISSQSGVSSVLAQESSSATGYDSSLGSVMGSPSVMQAAAHTVSSPHQYPPVLPQARSVPLRPLLAAHDYNGTSKSVPTSASSVSKRPLPPLNKQAPAKGPRWFCHVCDDAPRGFGARPELDRHQETKHPGGGDTVKWIAIPHRDIEGDHRAVLARGDTAEMMQLARKSTCNSCRYVKYYAREDNAASHLRRCHFNRREQGAKNQNRGGKSGGSEPALQWLKDNFFMMAVRVHGPDKKWLGASPPPGGRAARRRKASSGSGSYSSSVNGGTSAASPAVPTAAQFSHDINTNFTQQASFGADGSSADSGFGVNNFDMPMGMNRMYQFQGAALYTPRLLANDVLQVDSFGTTCPWDVAEWQQPMEEEQAEERDPFDDLVDWSAALSFDGFDATG